MELLLQVLAVLSFCLIMDFHSLTSLFSSLFVEHVLDLWDKSPWDNLFNVSFIEFLFNPLSTSLHPLGAASSTASNLLLALAVEYFLNVTSSVRSSSKDELKRNGKEDKIKLQYSFNWNLTDNWQWSDVWFELKLNWIEQIKKDKTDVKILNYFFYLLIFSEIRVSWLDFKEIAQLLSARESKVCWLADFLHFSQVDPW